MAQLVDEGGAEARSIFEVPESPQAIKRVLHKAEQVSAGMHPNL